MNDYITKGMVVAVVAVGILFVSYGYLSSQKIMTDDPPVVESTPTPYVQSTPKHDPAPPTVVTGSRIIPMEFPKTFYTTERIVETSDGGIKVIPSGTRISIINREGRLVTITDGKTIITTSETKITSDVGEIQRLTRKGV